VNRQFIGLSGGGELQAARWSDLSPLETYVAHPRWGVWFGVPSILYICTFCNQET
jgi:hypothetical protein